MMRASPRLVDTVSRWRETFGLLIIVVVVGCAGKSSRTADVLESADAADGTNSAMDAAALREMLTLDDEPLEGYGANLFLSFEGGFLEEDRLKINGQILLRGPDHLRLTGAYGAFKKVFDLRVVADRFQVLDHDANRLYQGDSDDPAAAEAIGFALRPIDLLRLLRVGGEGPLTGVTITAIAHAPDSLRVEFNVPGDDGAWSAGYRIGGEPQLTSLERRVGDIAVLRVVYDRFFRAAGRRMPKRVRVSRPTSDERLEIDVRSLKRMRPSTDRFRLVAPEGVEIVELSTPLGAEMR